MTQRVPHEALEPETLRRVIESFVMREGTDYGDQERSLDAKVADVRRQLEAGEAVLTWDARTESINIITRRTLDVPVQRDDGIWVDPDE